VSRADARRLPPAPRVPRTFQALLFYNRPLFVLLSLRARHGDCFRLREPALLGRAWWVWVCDERTIRGLLDAEPIVARDASSKDAHGPTRGSAPTVAPERLAASAAVCSSAAAAVAARHVRHWPRGRPFPLLSAARRIMVETMCCALGGTSEPDTVQRVERALAHQRRWDVAFLPNVRHGDGGPRAARRRRGARKRVAHALAASDASPADTIAHASEASALIVAWALEMLLRHRAVHAGLRADLEAGSAAYLDAVIAEALWARPIVLSVARELVTDRVICGYELPAGTLLRLAVGLAGFPRTVRARPEEFHPERFLRNGLVSRNGLLFGNGPSRCPGDRLALAAARSALREVILGVELEPVLDPPELSRFQRPYGMLRPNNAVRAVVAPLR
jgi:cytochrome P450